MAAFLAAPASIPFLLQAFQEPHAPKHGRIKALFLSHALKLYACIIG